MYLPTIYQVAAYTCAGEYVLYCPESPIYFTADFNAIEGYQKKMKSTSILITTVYEWKRERGEYLSYIYCDIERLRPRHRCPSFFIPIYGTATPKMAPLYYRYDCGLCTYCLVESERLTTVPDEQTVKLVLDQDLSEPLHTLMKASKKRTYDLLRAGGLKVDLDWILFIQPPDDGTVLNPIPFER